MRTVIPFDTRAPKRRLSPVLAPAERAAFARAMLQDVLAAMEPTALDPTVIATGPIEAPVSAPVTVDERPLDAVITDQIRSSAPVAVVMADLPLLRPAPLTRFAGTEGDVVLASGRGGGTNAMLVRTTQFETDYHGASIRDHRQIARDRDLSLAELDSYRFGTDVDEPADLLEVLLHGSGRSADWLDAAGFRVAAADGRATAKRSGDSE